MTPFGTPSYGITRRLPPQEHSAAVVQVTQALGRQGFGVLTTIDMTATLQAKLGVDLARPYTILGACNPPMANAAVGLEPAIGLLLPCNVVVTEEEGGVVVVSAIHPGQMFSVVENPALGDVAQEVEGRLTAALDELTGG